MAGQRGTQRGLTSAFVLMDCGAGSRRQAVVGVQDARGEVTCCGGVDVVWAGWAIERTHGQHSERDCERRRDALYFGEQRRDCQGVGLGAAAVRALAYHALGLCVVARRRRALRERLLCGYVRTQ